ncbi:MAG: TatD family hydrolase [Anaerolineae bacterium]|nr:TatD family hydrolase [Phycisphaerae bacterium]
MIDSHSHLTDPRLLEQLDDVLSGAAQARIDRMISIGTNIEDDRAVIAICRGRQNLRCAIGVHPNYCHEAKIEDVAALRELQKDPSVVALGEMGLDYFHKFADRATQVKFFEAQLALAQDVRRPVVIHSRDAIDDTLAIMRNFSTVPAVFHCFTGTSDEARRVIDAGYLLGYTGAVTFTKNEDLREAARQTPRDRLLIETDAPYLTPEPMRKQKTNQPSFVVHIAATIAQVWGTTVEAVDEITTKNVERFFGWNS